MNYPSRRKNSITRREALRTLGAGAAWLGLGLVTSRALVGAAPAGLMPPAPGPLAQPFVLPKLGYAFTALEPHLDARTLEIHHGKHHQGYVDKANQALAAYPELQQLSADEILKNLGALPEKIRPALRNQVGGHANHTLFWQVMGPATERGAPPAGLRAALDQTFGSFEAFTRQFSSAAAQHFGSGWAWLSVQGGALRVHTTANQDSPLSEGSTPVLGLDVWEHAYYLHYQNRRADYIAAFWNVVNWAQVEANYTAALKA